MFAKSTFSKVSLILLLVAFICSSFVAKFVQAQGCNDQKLSDIGACSTCCAVSGFNKFNHEQFLKDKKCQCYKDEAEMKLNSPGAAASSKAQKKVVVKPAN